MAWRCEYLKGGKQAFVGGLGLFQLSNLLKKSLDNVLALLQLMLHDPARDTLCNCSTTGMSADKPENIIIRIELMQDHEKFRLN